MTAEYFGGAKRDYTRAEKLAADIVTLAIEGGAEPDGTNLGNALKAIKRELREYRTHLAEARSLGTTLPNVMKSYRMTKHGGDYMHEAKNLVPERFHKVPAAWLKKLTVTKAERKHRTVMPLIIEAWQLAADYGDVREQMLAEYLTASAEDYERLLFMFINDLEEVDIDEEPADWEALPSVTELAESVRVATQKHDYGAGAGVFEAINWNEA